jgi:hypothetical protein
LSKDPLRFFSSSTIGTQCSIRTVGFAVIALKFGRETGQLGITVPSLNRRELAGSAFQRFDEKVVGLSSLVSAKRALSFMFPRARFLFYVWRHLLSAQHLGLTHLLRAGLNRNNQAHPPPKYGYRIRLITRDHPWSTEYLHPTARPMDKRKIKKDVIELYDCWKVGFFWKF